MYDYHNEHLRKAAPIVALDPRVPKHHHSDALYLVDADGNRHALYQAAGLATRCGRTFTPERELVGADFADQGDRILLAQLGYFSVDLKPHRAKREREALTKRYLEEAYDVAGLDRDQQHNLIAGKMEARKTDGIWAKSTGAYAIACRRLDDFMLRASPAIAQSIAELN